MGDLFHVLSCSSLQFGILHFIRELFVAIVDEFKTSESKAALVGSISYSLCLLFGCISSPLCTRFGCRQVAAVGSLMISLGLVLSSLVPSIELLYLTFGVLVAMGSSAVFFPSLLVLAENFDKNYALAVGIASSGTGAGGFIFAAITGEAQFWLVGAISYGPSPQTVATGKKRCVQVNFALELPLPLSKASSLLGYVSHMSPMVPVVHDLPQPWVTYCGVYGAFDGCFNSMLAVIVGDIVGKENLHSAIGAMYLLSSTFMMFGPPLAGYLYSTSGSYNSSFFIVGGAVALSSCLMFLVPWFIPNNVSSDADQLLVADSGSMTDSANTSSIIHPSHVTDTKEESWITFDSGIDITSKNNSITFSCTLDKVSSHVSAIAGNSSTITSSSTRTKAPTKARKLSRIIQRYIQGPRRVLVPGSITNSFAVSRLDLSNCEQLVVVDKVSIV
eukprot:gene16578-18264_t